MTMLIRTSLGVAAFLSASPVLAQTCSFSMSDMNFGFVNLASGSAVDSTATLNVSCSNPLSLALSVRICPNINAGSGGQSGGIRRMLQGSNSLNYQLYQNAGRTTSWGSAEIAALGSPPAIDLALPLLSNSTTRTVYGRILGSQASATRGLYLSSFAGAETRFNYASYTLLAPSCASMNDNPTQVAFNVTAAVEPTCIVTAQPINFGGHGVLNTIVDATGSISLTCTTNLAYSIALNGGLSNSPPASRQMVLAGSSITYGLYRDLARSNVWGSGTGQIATGTGTGTLQTLAVYGRVPVQSTPAPGIYSDTVVVTVSY
ncbi:Csu type fimbrial protein [Agrobacterium sp. rho-13.3]|uniref:Csu type fimbrial protein n=1 Tax=Agrobacterium sp. rho-13.3 TaxID=3072980 RepID=UPI002A0F0216|nr:spore coat U domain-containing protein [Agrobacterium sp. rho-13.3]MDX8308359.1 spore coat U domain-containing protein [Agrobacterium sp. rho-13.3]